MTDKTRVRAGVPAGGQFAAKQQSEADVTLGEISAGPSLFTPMSSEITVAPSQPVMLSQHGGDPYAVRGTVTVKLDRDGTIRFGVDGTTENGARWKGDLQPVHIGKGRGYDDFSATNPHLVDELRDAYPHLPWPERAADEIPDNVVAIDSLDNKVQCDWCLGDGCPNCGYTGVLDRD